MKALMQDSRVWLLLALLYCLAQAGSRLVLHGPALGLDEAEAFWFARDLAAGYNTQPPLYFWLQWLVFQLVGDSLAGLAVLKAGVLWATAALVFALIRTAFAVAVAGPAMLALVLLPEFSWEAQRALTHTPLAVVLAVAMVWTFHRALDRGRTGDFLLFGLVLGLAALSKHNSWLLLLALVLASLLTPAARAGLFRFYWLASMAVAAAVLAPYLRWVLANPGTATSGLAEFSAEAAPVSVTALVMERGLALASLLESLAGFFLLIALVLGLPWLLHRRRLQWPRDGLAGFLRLLFVAVIGLAALLAGVLGVADIKGRWLLPLLILTAPVMTAILWPALGTVTRRLLLTVMAGLWLAVFAALPSTHSYRWADFRVFGDQLPAGVPVVSTHVWILGNLALLEPDRPMVWSGADGTRSPELDGPFVIVTAADGFDRELAALGRDQAVSAPERVSLPGSKLDGRFVFARIQP